MKDKNYWMGLARNYVFGWVFFTAFLVVSLIISNIDILGGIALFLIYLGGSITAGLLGSAISLAEPDKF